MPGCISSRLYLAILLAVAVLHGHELAAQPLRTIYHGNGNKAIEGRWQYHMDNVLPATYEHATVQNSYFPFGDVLGMKDDKQIYRQDLWYLLSIQCQGLITTWYDNKVKKAEIHFEKGIPSGPYTRYHPNGQKAHEGNLASGMPQGRWQSYYPGGQLYFTGYFTPYADTVLHQRLQNRYINGDYALPLFKPDPSWEPEEYIDSLEEKDAYYLGYERVGFPTYEVRGAFSSFPVSSLSMKDGLFIFYKEDGTKQAEMTYRQDKRHGTWKLWKASPLPVLTLEYENGRLRYITDSNGRRSTAAYITWLRKHPSTAVSPNIIYTPEQKQVVHFAPQQPYFSQDILTYLQREMKLSDKVWRRSIGRTAKVSFFIEADGQVSRPAIDQSAGPAFDKELLRVVNAMPPWKPGMVEQKPVRMRHTLVLDYSLRVSAAPQTAVRQ